MKGAIYCLIGICTVNGFVFHTPISKISHSNALQKRSIVSTYMAADTPKNLVQFETNSVNLVQLDNAYVNMAEPASIVSQITPYYQLVKERLSKDRLKTAVVTVASSAILFFRSALKKVKDKATATSQVQMQPYQALALWACMFIFTSSFYSAESAITKISPWTVKQKLDEEGPSTVYTILNDSAAVTRMFITILLTTTALDIYNQTLFVTTMSQLFPNVPLAVITVFLTVITLFFGELMPKAIAVNNSETMARWLVPPLNRLSMLLSPVTSSITHCSDLLLGFIGMKSSDDESVSENMLRLVVEEAQRTESIQTGEGRMIRGVLDMQDKEVGRIMQPRVDIIAVEENDRVDTILRTATEYKYSRIPVYRQGIDDIVGVVFSKDLLDFVDAESREMDKNKSSDDHKNNYDNTQQTASAFAAVLTAAAVAGVTSTSDSSTAAPVPHVKDKWRDLREADLMDDIFYIPETMSCWNALQEMRKRRVHMAVVVDEYGGTAGLVTLEDILEEVVGEIYDEDDEEEREMNLEHIYKGPDGSYKMKGYADLDDVCEALGVDLAAEEQKLGAAALGEYSTIGGLLCSIAGRIPHSGDKIVFAGHTFTVLKVEEARRVVDVLAEPIKKKHPLATTPAVTSKSSGKTMPTKTRFVSREGVRRNERQHRPNPNSSYTLSGSEEDQSDDHNQNHSTEDANRAGLDSDASSNDNDSLPMTEEERVTARDAFVEQLLEAGILSNDDDVMDKMIEALQNSTPEQAEAILSRFEKDVRRLHSGDVDGSNKGDDDMSELRDALAAVNDMSEEEDGVGDEYDDDYDEEDDSDYSDGNDDDQNENGEDGDNLDTDEDSAGWRGLVFVDGEWVERQLSPSDIGAMTSNISSGGSGGSSTSQNYGVDL